MPQGYSPPAFNMGFLLQGKQAGTRNVSQVKKTQEDKTGTLERPSKRPGPPGAPPTVNPLYKITPIATTTDTMSFSESLHVRKMNVQSESGGSSINGKLGTASSTVSVTPTYKSTARITLQMSERSMFTGPIVQAVPGLNITSFAPATSVKLEPTSSASVKCATTLMPSVKLGSTSTASVKVAPTLTPTIASVTLTPTSTPIGKAKPTSMASVRFLPTPTPNVTRAPSPMPNVKLAPSPIPNANLAPSPMPNGKLAPSPMLNVKLAPSPMLNVKLAPSPMPSVKRAPSPVPSVKLAPSPMPSVKLAPSPMPSVKLAPSPMPNVNLAPSLMPNMTLAPSPTSKVKLETTSTVQTPTPIANIAPNIQLVSNSTNSLTLGPTRTLTPTQTQPAPYTPNAKFPSNPLRCSKLGLTQVPRVKSAPVAPSGISPPSSPQLPRTVNWAPISTNLTPPEVQWTPTANWTPSEKAILKEAPRRSSMPIPPPDTVTLAPVFAGNRPFINLIANPTPTTGTNQSPQNQSSDGESQFHKSTMNKDETRVMGRQSSPKRDRASQRENYSAGGRYSTPSISSEHHRWRSSQHSPVRVPSGEGILDQIDGESDDEAILKVNGHQMSRLERGSGTPVPGRDTIKSIVFKECMQSRQASPVVPTTLRLLSNNSTPVKMPAISPTLKMSSSTPPPLRMSTQSPTMNISANVVNLDIQEEQPDNEEATHRAVSESTKKLLDRWQVSMSSVPVKPPTTVTLLDLGDRSKTPRFMASPSLPSLNVHLPPGAINTDYSGRKGHRQDTPLTSSLGLGPDMANIASPEHDLFGSVRDTTSSYHMRMDYGKNLERIWYQKMVEEEEKRAAVRKLKKLVDIYKLDGSTDEFYKSFYCSFSGDELNVDDSDESDVSIDLNDQTEENGRSKVKSPMIRYASTDVLYSDQADSSGSEIDIVIKEDDLHDRRVRHKMRRKRMQRERKYQSLFGDDGENKFQKHTDENGDEIFLPDTEIRALRLNLKKEYDEDVPYNEDCTLEQLREQVMKALARINGNRKGKSCKKKKKKREPDESHGYGEHKHKSLYDRFLHEYGYLLAGYKIEPLSESDGSDTEEQAAKLGMDTVHANKSSTLPPISTSQTARFKNKQYGSRRGSKHNVHLPKLNYTYQSSPFSEAGMLIGDNYYTGSYTVRPNSKYDNPQNQDNLNMTPRKRKKQRLDGFLKGIAVDRLELLERSEPDKAMVASLSSRRMSDPGVYMGQMLVKQKIIHTELELEALNAQSKENTKPKKKKKGKSKLTTTRSASMETVSNKPQRPPSAKCGLQHTGEEFVDCKPLRRTGSARSFQSRTDISITLRELTKDLDFPSKEIKLQVAERRLRRQQQNRGRARRKQDQDSMADAFRMRRRSIIAAAKAEFLRQMEIARAKANKDQGYSTDDGSEEDEGIGGDGLRRSSKRRSSRLRKKPAPPFPPPDFRELLNTPVVPSGVNWGKVGIPRMNLSQGEIEEEAEDVSDLFLQMKECRWIRWTKTQQRILDHVNKLEMDLF